MGRDSREFAMWLCRHNRELRVAVLELLFVCEIDMEDARTEAERARIGFRKVDVPSDPLPGVTTSSSSSRYCAIGRKSRSRRSGRVGPC